MKTKSVTGAAVLSLLGLVGFSGETGWRVAYRHDMMTEDGWSAVSYENRTPGTFGGEWLGLRGLVIAAAVTNACDTSWSVITKRLDFGDAKSVRLAIESYAERLHFGGERRRRRANAWATWLDAQGGVLSVAELGVSIPPGRNDLVYEGRVFPGARALRLRFGSDQVDMKPGERLVFSNCRFSVSGADAPRPFEFAAARRLQFDVPQVTTRPDGVTLVDGKPFFPIGIFGMRACDFNGNDFDTMLRQLKGIGFNMGGSYAHRHSRELQEAAERNDFKLFVEVKRLDETFWRDSACKAILAWYLADDTTFNTTPSELYARDCAIREVDTRRITSHADAHVGVAGPGSSYSAYAKSSDNYQPEIYPIFRDTPEEASNCVAEVILEMRGILADNRRFAEGRAKSVWPILQYFEGWRWKRFPTEEELCATSFAALTEGARGIAWYTYAPRTWWEKGKCWNCGITSSPERWETMKGVSSWIAELAPVLVEPTPRQPPAPVILSGPASAAYGMPTITFRLQEKGSVKYLLAVNATRAPVKAEFALGLDGVAKVQRQDREVPVANGRLVDDFAPFGVHVYEIRSR